MHFHYAEQELFQGNIAFLPGLFEETANMLIESHNYFEQLDELESGDAYLDMLMANEMARITMRLTNIMAWVMIRKAVNSGHLDAGEALEEYPLDGIEICLQDSSDIYHILPDYFAHLLDRSHDLYMRIYRLDRMVEREEKQQPLH